MNLSVVTERKDQEVHMHGLSLIKIEEMGILQRGKRQELVEWLDVCGKF